MNAYTTPDFSLSDRIVLVTGASRGIGRACALACAGAGADVVVGVRKDADGAELTGKIRELGRRALAVDMDLADLGTVRAAVARVQSEFGRIDVLINNVGVGPENPAESVTEQDFDFTLNINLKGTFFTTQAVGRLMIAQKSGRIVNISSQAGTVVLKGEAIYCMTKAAINHLTRCLAFEWARPQHHRQQRVADLHLDRRHAAVIGQSRVSRPGSESHSAGPHRRTARRRRNGGVPRLAGRRADHRREHPGRRRLVGRLISRLPSGAHP